MRRPAIVFVLALLTLLGVYAPALRGPFVSDDYLYLGGNPWVQRPNAESLAAMLDPRSEATTSVQNYAPVTLFVHAAAWRAFGSAPLGHHLLNLALHALVSALLLEVFVAAGIALPAAAAGSLWFALHPANVEAVAWASQLKTTAALALALGALLARATRPGVALALFGLALGAKASALFALPVALCATWLEAPRAPARAADAATRSGSRRAAWAWLAAWAALALVYSVAQLPANQHTNAAAPPLHPDALVRARSIVAIVGRYLVLAATGLGASTFHEPPPALRWGDPWFVVGLAGCSLLAARFALAARRRCQELVFWVWSAAAFAPVSQIVPFLYPMADRYLYTILPGLLGGTLLAVQAALAGLRAPAARRALGVTFVLLLCGLAGGLGLRSHARAAIFATPGGVVDDAIAHYPSGTSALLRHAQQRAQAGDAEGALRALRAVKPFALEMNALLSDPALARLRGVPEFDALVREVAGRWTARGAALSRPGQGELRQIAIAHLVRGETAEARAALERGLALGGPRSEELRADLEQVARVEAALRAKRSPGARSTSPDQGGTPTPAGP